MKASICWATLVVLYAMGPMVTATAQVVEFAPTPSASLDDQWRWGAGLAGPHSVAWALPGAPSSDFFGRSGRTLLQLIGGVPTDETMMAVVVRVEGGRPVDVDQVRLDSPLGDETRTIAWLGEVSQQASFLLLESLYGGLAGDGSPAEDGLRGIVYAMGIHRDIPAAGTFLRTVLRGRGQSGSRKAAAYALAAHSGVVVLDELVEVALRDSEVEVAKAAAYAIGSTESDAAVGALERVIRLSDHGEVKKAAVYAIGNIGTDRARGVLLALISSEGQ